MFDIAPPSHLFSKWYGPSISDAIPLASWTEGEENKPSKKRKEKKKKKKRAFSGDCILNIIL